MGYRGKLQEQAQARRLRAEGRTVKEIAARLRVARPSVSLWVRDVEFQPRLLRPSGRRRGPNGLQRKKAEEIARLLAEGRDRIGQLTEKEFLVAGAALYAGEGGKTPGKVKFTNSDPAMVAFFCAWLRHFFVIDESSGPDSPPFRSASSTRLVVPRPTRASAGRSIRWAVRRSYTAAPGRTAPSWVSRARW